ETEIALLIAAIKLITHFGGQKARGLGRVQVEVAQAWLKAGEEWHSRDPKELLRLLQEVRP
ncbi:MAG: hypothetical protein NZM28_01935, partial [Fimbriimonadales bacterium]|nr:hypothetical protein [Fimbriimonadales bacterium]